MNQAWGSSKDRPLRGPEDIQHEAWGSGRPRHWLAKGWPSRCTHRALVPGTWDAYRIPETFAPDTRGSLGPVAAQPRPWAVLFIDTGGKETGRLCLRP